MEKILIVGAGGFIGAVARYLICRAVGWLHGGALPLGTLIVNVLGCFIIGVAVAVVENRSFLGPNIRLLLIIGLLGSFTTFSAFGHETVELLREGQLRWALFNLVASIFLGIGAVVLGRFLSKAVGI